MLAIALAPTATISTTTNAIASTADVTIVADVNTTSVAKNTGITLLLYWTSVTILLLSILLLLLLLSLCPEIYTFFYQAGNQMNWKSLVNWGPRPSKSQLLFIIQLSWVVPDHMASDTLLLIWQRYHKPGTPGFLTVHPSWGLSDSLSFSQIGINVFPLTWIIESAYNRNIFQYYMMFTDFINGLGEIRYTSIENCRDGAVSVAQWFKLLPVAPTFHMDVSSRSAASLLI